jgi:putative transposase
VRIYRLVDQERAHHAVSLLCSVLAVSRQAYYDWRGRPPSTRELRDVELKALIVEVFDESRRTYGAPRIAKTLRRKRGQPVATKRIARLMSELGLQGLSRGGKGRGTTVQDPAARPAPDLLERDFTAAAPNLVWVADITYLRCYDGWLYLAIVMDLFSRKIVGWSMRDTLEAEIVSDALAMAVARRRPAAGVVHHSDRGSQYTSLLMGKTLRELGVVASMGSRGCAYDNAACESAIGTIKLELVEQHVFATRDVARLRVFDYIEAFYNPLRMHTTLGDLSPDEYEAAYHATPTDAAIAA